MISVLQTEHVSKKTVLFFKLLNIIFVIDIKCLKTITKKNVLFVNELMSPVQHKDYSDAHVLLLFLTNTEHGQWRKQIMIYDWWSGIE